MLVFFLHAALLGSDRKRRFAYAFPMTHQKSRMGVDMNRWAEILKDAPEVIARVKVPGLLGGLIAKGTLQNLDSEGRGPRRIFLGKRVGYAKQDLIAWLNERAK
jgi:hypothetical protein